MPTRTVTSCGQLWILSAVKITQYFKLSIQVSFVKNCFLRENDRLIAKYLERRHKGCFCLKCNTSQKFLVIQEVLNSRGKKTRRVLTWRTSLSLTAVYCSYFFFFSLIGLTCCSHFVLHRNLPTLKMLLGK